MLRRLLLLCTLLMLAACTREPLHQAQSYVFGTLVEVSIYGEEHARAQALTDHVLREFERLHRQYHAWQPGSELDRLNGAIAQGRPFTASPELIAMLVDAGARARQSGGLFNPAIGNLIGLWGFQRDEFTPVTPDPAALARRLAENPQMADIVIAGNQVRSRNRAVRLDFGGYAKGYALDIASAYLREQRVAGALVNIGGNIIAVGRRGERPWRVGIQHPRAPGPIATLELPDGWAIGTSGDYQRYFERDGKRYCHIIDPRSGVPAQGVQAVTVLVPPGASSGRRSDADSKPIFIAGSGWRAAARQMQIEHAMLIDSAGRIHLTAAMRQHLTFVDPHVALDVVP